MTDFALIGRQRETAWLTEAVSDALAGRGALLLLAGEAGVGKTHLAEAALLGAPLLRGAAQPPGAAAYGPVVAALRWGLRSDPPALDGCGPLRPHLAMLLPELGPPAPSSDRATMFEAIRCALCTLAPALVLLDDLQWSDGATLELLSALAAPLRDLPLLVVAAYRSDEIGRGHPLRRLRADLRRGRLLREIVVAPLDQAASTELAARVLGGRPSLKASLNSLAFALELATRMPETTSPTPPTAIPVIPAGVFQVRSRGASCWVETTGAGGCGAGVIAGVGAGVGAGAGMATSGGGSGSPGARGTGRMSCAGALAMSS